MPGRAKPWKNFGGALRDLREARNKTQAQVGEIVGMTAQDISALERGKRPPLRAHQLWALCSGLYASRDAAGAEAAWLCRQAAIDHERNGKR